ncbi:hypothetical protein [Neptuniibacter sp. QD37_11]|uniref:hypothetical protein n=1 Tax=Neptuniibacter sp. QD37_11 TaxID=3398209 RepID=UPI0039F448A1
MTAPNRIYYLRTKTQPHFYVSALHGVCYTSFVTEADKAHALELDVMNIELLQTVEKITKTHLEFIAGESQLLAS